MFAEVDGDTRRRNIFPLTKNGKYIQLSCLGFMVLIVGRCLLLERGGSVSLDIMTPEEEGFLAAAPQLDAPR